jgi:hypothetical protein
MLLGYRDGLKHMSPTPSNNRSLSYRHGFDNGRRDIGLLPLSYTAQPLRDRAEECIRADTGDWYSQGYGML